PDIMINCWRIVGMRGNTRTDAAEMMRLLATSAVQADRLITHRYALSEALSGLRAAQSRNSTAPTVRYHWTWGILNESGARRQSHGLTRSTP
ncbi:hypothetical protein, partial [Mycobacterium timonense]